METMSPAKREYQEVMNENLNGEASSKIIAYKNKPPAAPEGNNSVELSDNIVC